MAGCATVTPEGERVRTTRNQQATVGCRFIGNVRQSLTAGGPVDTEKALREKAARLGADTLYIGPTNASWAAPMEGEAYLCGTPK